MSELVTQVQHEEVTQRSRSLTSFPAQEGQVQMGGGGGEEGGAQDNPTPWKQAPNASWLGPYIVGELQGKCKSQGWGQVQVLGRDQRQECGAG